MNVTDVRDMEQSQSLFWAIAMPLTLGVVGIAYVYGYKLDSLSTHIERWRDDLDPYFRPLAAAKSPVTAFRRTAKAAEMQETDNRTPTSWMRDALDDLQRRRNRLRRQATV